jgi:hypothetical protein
MVVDLAYGSILIQIETRSRVVWWVLSSLVTLPCSESLGRRNRCTAKRVGGAKLKKWRSCSRKKSSLIPVIVVARRSIQMKIILRNVEEKAIRRFIGVLRWAVYLSTGCCSRWLGLVLSDVQFSEVSDHGVEKMDVWLASTKKLTIGDGLNGRRIIEIPLSLVNGNVCFW